jgi:hypothetical protein
MENNIVAFAMGDGLYCGSGSSPVLRWNDVFGNSGNDYGGTCSDQTGLNGNISSDPLFADTSAVDYHLLVDSPCIDAGDTSVTAQDRDGSRNDMGAYGGPQGLMAAPSYSKNLRVVADSTVVSLVWDPGLPEDSVAYYVVHRDSLCPFDPGSWSHYTETFDTSFVDSAVGLDRTYAYRVTAVNARSYQGGYSHPVGVETSPVRDGVLTASYRWGPAGTHIRGDVVCAGTGLGDTGNGTIVLSGIPEGSPVVKALLYWDESPHIRVNGMRVGATRIGGDGGISSYRGDVGHIVEGGGAYEVVVDQPSDGASLVVVFEDSSLAERAIQINDGLDTEGDGSGGTFDRTHFPYDQNDSVFVCYIVGGGSEPDSELYYYNGHVLAADSANAGDGNSWDTDWFAVPWFAIPPEVGEVECTAHIEERTDSLRWVAAVNVGHLLSAGVRRGGSETTARWRLGRITPNPFESGSSIGFTAPVGGGHLSLKIYSPTGELVATLVDGIVGAGHHSTPWTGTSDSGNRVSPGLYFIRMKAEGADATKKIILLE